jgi:tetraacyldisaccharide 4'-kinase
MSFLGIIFFPFTLIYDLVTRVRNFLFDSGYKRSFEFETNVIGVGNLTVGGTGKSPMVEYLIRLLADKNRVATLSRGYGRNTKGFRITGENDNADTVGDEPYQFYNKFKNITVAVGEERAMAIPFILAERNSDVIILDDAFQHRYVKPSFNIMLTDYTRLFYNDYVLPSGRLREARRGAKRADVIVVTKCPEDISDSKMDEIEERILTYAPGSIVAFSGIRYLSAEPVFESTKFSENIILFSGIANNKHLMEYVSTHFALMDEYFFPDHHGYTKKDLQGVEERFQRMPIQDKCLITTEKDMVKLLNSTLGSTIEHLPVFYIPIETYFIRNGKTFDENVLKSIKRYID